MPILAIYFQQGDNMAAIDEVSIVPIGNFAFVQNSNKSRAILATVEADSNVNTGPFPQQFPRRAPAGGGVQAGIINAGQGQYLSYTIVGAHYVRSAATTKKPVNKTAKRPVGKKKSAKKKAVKK